ncbi:hypothetical protein [Sodalis glossinidius]|uniref:hypothetical protein n=1 Tax=Sodalis glossinidius TaxID=63612 RepID=UPI0002E3CB80|nr:hypothetical protein [Sodalis glossinidius]
MAAKKAARGTAWCLPSMLYRPPITDERLSLAADSYYDHLSTAVYGLATFVYRLSKAADEQPFIAYQRLFTDYQQQLIDGRLPLTDGQ